MNPTIYIDQNILGYLADGSLVWPVDQYQLVFAETHFKEMSSSRVEPFLSALDKCKARLLKINVNGNFEIQDSATILNYSPTGLLYKDYLSRESSNSLEGYFHPLLARLFGSKETAEYDEMGSRFNKFIHEQFPEESQVNFLKMSLSKIMEILLREINSQLEHVPNIELQRKSIGTDKGKIGYYNGKGIIRKIGDYIKKEKNTDYLNLIEQQLSNKPACLKVSALNTFLIHLGYRPDSGLSKLDKLSNVRHDSEHISNAIFCNYFLTEDKRLAWRAAAIYEYLSLDTKVIRLDPER
jgi:hypothetical protein